MALGKPVVASKIPSNKAIVEHGVTGFLAADKGEFITYITALIESPPLRKKLGDAAKQRIHEHYDARTAARKYAELYATVLERL